MCGIISDRAVISARAVRVTSTARAADDVSGINRIERRIRAVSDSFIVGNLQRITRIRNLESAFRSCCEELRRIQNCDSTIFNFDDAFKVCRERIDKRNGALECKFVSAFGAISQRVFVRCALALAYLKAVIFGTHAVVSIDFAACGALFFDYGGSNVIFYYVKAFAYRELVAASGKFNIAVSGRLIDEIAVVNRNCAVAVDNDVGFADLIV